MRMSSSSTLAAMLVKETGAQSVLMVDDAASCQRESNLGAGGAKFFHACEADVLAASDSEPLPTVDMAVWLTGAHHLALPDCLRMIQRLVSSARIMAFAAEPPPFQQDSDGVALWPDQWARLFDVHQFVLVDAFRDTLCRDRACAEGIAQNLVLFVGRELLEKRPDWRASSVPSAKRIVHPDRICRHAASSGDSGAGSPVATYIDERWRAMGRHPECGEVTVVMTFHREGFLAQRSLNGLEMVVQVMADAGLKCDIVCTLDNADAATTDVVSRHELVRRFGRVLVFKNSDLSSSRNHAVDSARGDYVAIMDGDDFYSPRWLLGAYHRCRQFSQPVIVHPEFVVNFGIYSGIAKVVDTSETGLEGTTPITENRWVAASFAPRVVYESIPYSRPDLAISGFGYEDWHWNCETLAAGIHHVSAHETALFYRRRANSMVMEHSTGHAIIRPTAFLRSPRQAKMCQKVGD